MRADDKGRNPTITPTIGPDDMIAPEPFEYDVAISFLSGDEALATAIHSELSGRLKVFLYSKRQEQLAGSEGDLAFAEVFKVLSRVVIVLYRQAWGDTLWTRVEMNAIRSRALKEGWGFCLFVPLEGRTAPEYVPEVNIWYDVATFGTKSLIAIVLRMAEEHGARSGRDDAIGKATRLAQFERFRLHREQFRGSIEAVQALRNSFATMCNRANELTTEISEGSNGALKFSTKGPIGAETNVERHFVVLANNVGLLVYAWVPYANTLNESYLELAVFKGHPPLPGSLSWAGKQEPLAVRRYEFDVAPLGNVWKLAGSGGEEIGEQLLADTALKFLIEHQTRVTRIGGGR